MGATNVPWQLDPAVLRPGRFDEKVYIPLPDLPARRKMLDIYLVNRPLDDNIDLNDLAHRLEGYSGADIKYLCDRSATIPFPGIKPEIVDEQGNPVERGSGGFLVVKRPWPGMFRTLFGDDERYVRTYFTQFGPEVYVTGDGAKQDEDGYFWLMGRIDDVINVAGHRLSTTEIESTLVEHPAVAEAAATGAYDPERGQRIVCFVLLKSGFGASDDLSQELREFVAEKIGKIARPAAVLFGDDLPKTRSGKIMRRLLRNIAEGDDLGDTTTLRDPAIVDDLKRKADAALGRSA